MDAEGVRQDQMFVFVVTDYCPIIKTHSHAKLHHRRGTLPLERWMSIENWVTSVVRTCSYLLTSFLGAFWSEKMAEMYFTRFHAAPQCKGNSADYSNLMGGVKNCRTSNFQFTSVIAGRQISPLTTKNLSFDAIGGNYLTRTTRTAVARED